LVAKSNQAARWRLKLESNSASTVIHHFSHLPLAAPDGLSDNTNKLFRTINHHLLDRFQNMAIVDARYRLRLGHLHLITFTTHHLDQYRELEFTASGNFEQLGRLCFLNAYCYVA